MDRLWRPERQLVYDHLCFEEPESQVAIWTKRITEFALFSEYQLGSIFTDRGVSTGGLARRGVIELLTALRLPDAYGVVVPALAHLYSDTFTQQVLIHMARTDSQLLASANLTASSSTASSAAAGSGS
jgi:hypothetical protein